MGLDSSLRNTVVLCLSEETVANLREATRATRLLASVVGKSAPAVRPTPDAASHFLSLEQRTLARVRKRTRTNDEWRGLSRELIVHNRLEVSGTVTDAKRPEVCQRRDRCNCDDEYGVHPWSMSFSCCRHLQSPVRCVHSPQERNSGVTICMLQCEHQPICRCG